MTMKHLAAVFILLLVSTTARAQTIGDMIIGVGSITLPIEDSSNLKSSISSFITSSATRAGILASQFQNARFVTNVSAVQLDGDRIQINGIPLWVAEIQYDFSVVESSSGNQFASYSLTIKQTGDSENDLMRQSVKELNSKRNAFVSFMSQTKSDILKYYTDNMDRLLKNAESFKAQQDFDSAMRLLGQIPRECEGYDKVEAAIEQAFNDKIEFECDSRMVQFNVLRGQQKFDEAIEMLMELPNGSSCHAKSAKLIQEVQNDVCSIYIQNAESNHKLGNTAGALENLLGLDQLTPTCARRKNALETQIRAQLDEEARLKWEQQQREYRDRIELTHKQMDQQHELVSTALQNEAKLRTKKMELDYELAKRTNQNQNSQLNNYVNNSRAEYVVMRSMAKDFARQTNATTRRYLNAYYRRIMT
jgi:tetratricopeptide (TPR) repeat protein